MNNASLELGGTNWAEKDGNILGYSVGDTSGNFSPQEFTFARGSNLSATRIDRAGLIVKGRENVLTYSNDFSNAAWVKSNASVTSGQSGYDGTNNAWLLKGNTSNLAHRVYNAVSNTNINTLSVYVKASGHNYIQILSGNTVNQYANFDLSDGSIGNYGVDFTPKIESVGNDWYRISAFNNSDLVYSYIQLVSSKTAVWNESWAMPNNTDGVLIQDAQAELGLAASPYIESGATNGTAGVLENTPRLNYTTGVANPYLLLEPSRTNLLVQSEYFEASYWTKNDGSLTSGFVSPDGTSNAYKFVEDTSTGTHNIEKYISSANGSTNTSTIYAKKGERTHITLYSGGGFTDSCNFDLENGTSIDNGTSTSKIELISNGWYKCSVTAINKSKHVYIMINNGLSGTNGVVYTGDGTSGVYIFGAMMEEGSYPTSYIPTYSVSATRAEDVCNKTNASGEIGQTEGTIFVDLTIDNILGQTNQPIPLSLKGLGSTNSYIQLYNTGRVQAVHYGFGSIQANINLFSYGLTDGRHKFAFVYSDNDFKLYIDGALAGSETSGLVDAQSEVYLGYYNTSYNGTINNHQTLIFPTALTNAELATLTTI